jgi:serine/threonine protein phosphatase PrpC
VFLPAGRTSPGLSIARAFGDILLSSVGVVPTPDFAVFPLTTPPADSDAADAAPAGPRHVLIVASDGLWEFVSSQAAVDIAAAAGSPERAAELLAEAGQQGWEAAYGQLHCDDITVAVAYL